MQALYILSVWVHIVAAAVWVGSMAFFAIVVAPVIRSTPPEVVGPIVRKLGTRFRVLGWVSLAVLVVTGITNLLVRGIGFAQLIDGAFWATPLGRALAPKLVTVAAVVGATLGHDLLFTARTVDRLGVDPSAPDVARRRRIGTWLGRSTLLLSLLVLLFAVVMVRGAPW
jgi:putative copper export protein